MSYHMTQAYDYCPRCKSGQTEETELMYGKNRCVVEHLRCYNCGLEFKQYYQYIATVGEWDDDGGEEE